MGHLPLILATTLVHCSLDRQGVGQNATLMSTSGNWTINGTINSGAIQGSGTIDSTKCNNRNFLEFMMALHLEVVLEQVNGLLVQTSQVGNWSLYAVGTFKPS